MKNENKKRALDYEEILSLVDELVIFSGEEYGDRPIEIYNDIKLKLRSLIDSEEESETKHIVIQNDGCVKTFVAQTYGG